MPKEDKKKENVREDEPKKAEKVGCPLCGDTESLRSQGRCVTCLLCGWSTCSI